MRSSTASVTWTPQNGIPMHPIYNSACQAHFIELRNSWVTLKIILKPMQFVTAVINCMTLYLCELFMNE